MWPTPKNCIALAEYRLYTGGHGVGWGGVGKKEGAEFSVTLPAPKDCVGLAKYRVYRNRSLSTVQASSLQACISLNVEEDVLKRFCE